jgi:hypothetical protein
MQRQLVVFTIACLGGWLATGSTALAQLSAQYNPGPSQIREYYNRTTDPAPTLSPYVNLGINPNGLSNYQTFVKPMIDDRDALRTQSSNLLQLRQQLGDPRTAKNERGARNEAKPGTQLKVRFMHYSHFYGTPTE